MLGALQRIPAYPVVTWASADDPTIATARATTGLNGTLAGDVTAKGMACFWLVTSSDSAIGLLWPPHYSARGNPLTIYNEKGSQVAKVGEDVSLDGATTAPETVLRTGIPGCPNTSSVALVAP